MNLKKLMYSVAVGAGLMLGAGGMALATPSGPGSQPVGFGTNESNNGVNQVQGVAGTNEGASDGIIGVVQNFLNRVLGLLALVAFAMLLYGGFQMVTAGGDQEGYKKGFTVLKNAAIGLAFIGLSWMIIQLIFYVLGIVAGAGNTGVA